MGVLRGIGRAIGGLIFTLALSGLIFSIGLVQFTEYENMKAIFSELFGAQIGGGIKELGTDGTAAQNVSSGALEEVYKRILLMCEGRDSIQVPSSEPDKFITINCNELRAATQAGGGENITTAIGNVAANALFDNVYYKKYDCEFLDCLQTGQLGIVLSAQGHEFFNSMQIYSAVATAAGAVIIIIASEKWSERMKGLGWPLVFTGVSYFLVDFTKSFIGSKMTGAQQAGIDLTSIIDKIFAPMMSSFLVALVAGVVLTAGGYALAYKEKRKSAPASKKNETSKK